MNILVTGGYGFIGWQFIQLAKNSDRIKNIVNVDKLTYAACNAPQRLRQDNLFSSDESYGKFIKACIADDFYIKWAIKEFNIDTIINFAAETHVDNSIHSNLPFIETNITGTACLLDAARKNNCRFIQVSTDEVYGHLAPKDPCFNEQSPYNPRNPYSATKAAADHLTMAYGNTYNMPVVVTHCSNNYGPGQHTEKLIPKTICNALNGRPIPVYGDGLQIRDWIYVQDHAQAILQIVERVHRGNNHYCIGASNEITNLQLVNTICSKLDAIKPLASGSYKDLIVHVQDRPGHDRRYAIDSSCIARDYQWEATTAFEDGINKTIEYYLNA
jgi:dTDP-glucose 4,6-dehydratase